MKKDLQKIICVDYFRNVKLIDILNLVSLTAVSLAAITGSISYELQRRQIWGESKDKDAIKFMDALWKQLHP